MAQANRLSELLRDCTCVVLTCLLHSTEIFSGSDLLGNICGPPCTTPQLSCSENRHAEGTRLVATLESSTRSSRTLGVPTRNGRTRINNRLYIWLTQNQDYLWPSADHSISGCRNTTWRLFFLSNLLVSYSIMVVCYLCCVEGNRTQSASITLSVLFCISALQTVRRHDAGHVMYSVPLESDTM